METNYRVLLFYKYVTIEEAETFTQQHLDYCKGLGIKGRILISEEGINGTLSGTIEQTDEYMDHMKQDQRFNDILWKIDKAEGHAFKKMHVRYRSEIVSLQLGEEDLNPNELTGQYLSPKEFKEALLDEDTVVIDARNNYEFDLGHFRGAIRPDIRNFRELPEWIQENKEKFMEKRVVTYCTGGIRCEKFSGWLVKEGFKDVGQLHGGIAVYGKDPEVQGELWDGKMYVFDERIAVDINRKEHVIVGKDWFDGSPCERYINCANPDCNRQMLCSVENEHKFMRSCCHDCRVARPNYYVDQQQLTEEEFAERMAEISETVR